MSSPDVMSSPRGLPDRRSRRRDSRPTSRNTSSPYYRDLSTASMTNLFNSFTWPSTDFANLQPLEQTSNTDLFNSFELLSPTQADPAQDSIVHSEEGWVTVAPHSPSSAWSGSALLEHTFNQFLAQTVSGPQSPISSKISVSSPSWDILPSNKRRLDSDLRNSGPDVSSGVHGSLEHDGLATPNTFTSSFSEGAPVLGSSPGYASPMRGGSEVLRDMTLPGMLLNIFQYIDYWTIRFGNCQFAWDQV